MRSKKSRVQARPAAKGAVALHPHPVPAVVHPMSDEQAFIALIDRAARDPKFDVEKFQTLMAARAEDKLQRAKVEYSNAMVDCQDGMRPIKKNMQADRFKYASLEALDDALRPIYSKAGFALSYTSEPIEGSDKRMLIICDVLHKMGHERRYSVPMTVSTTGPKGAPIMTQTQGEGASVSMGRRYLLLMIFNIITSEDDAAITMNGGKVSDAQLLELQTLLRQKPPINEATFCAYMGVDALINLPVSKFDEAKDAILDKRKGMETQ